MFAPRRLLPAWGKVLLGKVPILSIEVTRECPLNCPGCYAYGDTHLGGGVTLRELSDLRGDALVRGVIDLVRYHGPLHVSLVGGEPLVRHRELDRILPVLSEMSIFTMVVTSGVIAIPANWVGMPNVRIAVSVDGLAEDHDVRRKPATYERILRNIRGRTVDISWVVTQQMMGRPGYLEEYLAFWSARSEVDRIGLNIYTPQVGEESAERLTPETREELVRKLPELKRRFPALWMSPGVAEAFGNPPSKPSQCTFSLMSVNYSADLKTRVEPCVFGGTPDCSQCGCGATALFHWIGSMGKGPFKASHLIRSTIATGRLANRLRRGYSGSGRWLRRPQSRQDGTTLVQIGR